MCVRMCACARIHVYVCVGVGSGGGLQMQEHALSLVHATTLVSSRHPHEIWLGTLLSTLKPCLCLGICGTATESRIAAMMHAGLAFDSRQVVYHSKPLPAVVHQTWPPGPFVHFCMIHVAVSVCCVATSLHKTARVATGQYPPMSMPIAGNTVFSPWWTHSALCNPRTSS